MTDVQNLPADQTEEVNSEMEQTIASLKKRADLLGIKYKSNVSIATLQKAISEKLEEPTGTDEEDTETEAQTTSTGTKAKAAPTKAELTEAAHKEAMKLVRVIITPMEATKATNLESELFCAGNSVVGTIKRTIPFGVEWHVERILLNSIKEKKYQMFTSKKGAQGVDVTSTRLVPAYSITELPPLTQEELDKLADMQIRTGSLTED